MKPGFCLQHRLVSGHDCVLYLARMMPKKENYKLLYLWKFIKPKNRSDHMSAFGRPYMGVFQCVVDRTRSIGESSCMSAEYIYNTPIYCENCGEDANTSTKRHEKNLTSKQIIYIKTNIYY